MSTSRDQQDQLYSTEWYSGIGHVSSQNWLRRNPRDSPCASSALIGILIGIPLDRLPPRGDETPPRRALRWPRAELALASLLHSIICGVREVFIGKSSAVYCEICVYSDSISCRCNQPPEHALREWEGGQSGLSGISRSNDLAIAGALAAWPFCAAGWVSG